MTRQTIKKLQSTRHMERANSKKELQDEKPVEWMRLWAKLEDLLKIRIHLFGTLLPCIKNTSVIWSLDYRYIIYNTIIFQCATIFKVVISLELPSIITHLDRSDRNTYKLIGIASSFQHLEPLYLIRSRYSCAIT